MNKPSLGERLNNPLNIRYNKENNWRGQIGSVRGFCQFDNIDHGIRAACRLVMNYPKPLSVKGIISRWAPPTENDTKGYIRFVMAGFPTAHEDDELENIDQLSEVLCRMAQMETGMYLNKNLFYSWLFAFNNGNVLLL